MQFNEAEFNLWIQSYSKDDTKRLMEFDDAHGMLSNSMSIFNMMRLADNYPLEDSVETSRNWDEAMRLCALVASTAVYVFAYDKGLSRLLNLLMIQSLAMDRKVIKAIQCKILIPGMLYSRLENHALHILWFVTRWKEWKGEGTWEEMIGPPALKLMSAEKWVEVEKNWKNLQEQVSAYDGRIESTIAEVTAEIAERIENAQAQDFDVNATSIGWWQEASLMNDDFTESAYWDPLELEDVLTNVDPQERRRFLANVERLHGIELPPYFSSPNPFIGGMALKIKEEKGDEALIEYVADINEFASVYMLFRAFHNDHPSQNLLWYICMLNYFVGIDAKELTLRFWKECHTALESHVAPIWGLWLLDLGRQLLHKGLFGDAFGQEMLWIHQKERKLLKAIQTGNYTTES